MWSDLKICSNVKLYVEKDSKCDKKYLILNLSISRIR